ncbi:uncharacterized protein SPPG_01731 [Spizellomyces punctatus DAOM BR117]|uniref:BTB domain-containing protein n=1 Tax=Spizellomyces punctatus (strain DAOM BR117) TaxID=645134 RepID=A0A0L0HPC6_SPIPD|nr:uncharacterized protein SPPG_01731 [Spizellomyces punctatus DAOM BR117]KND02644.1 hypothetical protein SPPG_01731 [Spizellomyces punctatus DAOM BR117]|eukprot:XP_016610683.1 hypothetical protein SPPG_01731 [Spizellomyces punctatus DAOM BR117]
MFAAVRNRDVSTLRSLLLGSDTSSSGHTGGPGSGSFGSLGKHSVLKQRKGTVDPNERDGEGNTVLHIAVASGNVEAVNIILQCPKLNVNVQDTESGYTALHKALYDGNLSLALHILRQREDCDLTIRDREGNTCLGLLVSTIESATSISEPLPPISDPPAERSYDSDEDSPSQEKRTDDRPDAAASLWTWGSNTNYLLGHQNSDDRAFPERVDITATYRKSDRPTVTVQTFSEHDPDVKSIVLSKYHSAILTSDRLFTNGVGSGGRLGLGDEDTMLRPMVVRGVKGKVASLAVGPEHTVAVTTTGDIWTWGSNRYGQLGYVSETVGKDTPCELKPREVGGTLKRVRILGAAASRHHTAAFSDAGTIYTWGISVGQLGYQQPLNTIHNYPKKVTDFPQQNILQLSATKSATAVLTESYEVFVFAEFKYSRVTFPFQQFPKHVQVHHPRTEKPPYITKIVSGNHQFAALTSAGDVFLWSPPEKQFAETWQHLTFPQRRPKKVWSVRKKHLAARDVAVGIDSSIIIRTDSGHVFIGIRRKDAKVRNVSETDEAKDVVYFKYHKIPYLQHVQHVVASASGAYGAIRLDRRPRTVTVSPGTLREDIHKAFSADPDPDKPDFHGVGIGPDVEGVGDVVFVTRDKRTLHAHRVILACRSPFFKRLFCDGNLLPGTKKTVKDVTVEFKLNTMSNVVEISVPTCHSRTLSLLLDYIYSGGFRKAWDHTIFMREDTTITPHGSLQPSTIYKEFNQFAKTFQLGDTDVIQLTDSKGRAYHQHIFSILNDSKDTYDQFSDVLLRLSDRDVRAHRVILTTRCPFFNAMLGSGSRWSFAEEGGLALVQLDHFRFEVMEVVLRYIYGDGSADEVFAGIEKRGISEFVEFTIEVLAAANELLLERLKEICAVILERAMDIRNMVAMLVVADTYEATKLKDACLNFVCRNMETAVECRMLEDVAEELITDIENRLRDMQSRKYPFTRGENSIYQRIRAIAVNEEEERKRRRRSAYDERKRVEREMGLVCATSSYEEASAGSKHFPLRESTEGDSGDDQKDVPRERGFDGEEEDLFEMEMEAPMKEGDKKTGSSSQEACTPTPGAKATSRGKKDKRAWRKLDLNGMTAVSVSPVAATTTAPPVAPAKVESPSPVKTWGAVIAKDQKASFRDIMDETRATSSTPVSNLSIAMASRKKSFLDIMAEAEAKPPTSPDFSVGVQKRTMSPSPAKKPPSATSAQRPPAPISTPTKPAPWTSSGSPATPSATHPCTPPPVSHFPITIKVTSPSRTKMSQKERRKSAAAAKASLPSPPLGPSPSPWANTVPAWGLNSKPNGTGSMGKTLKQIQDEERAGLSGGVELAGRSSSNGSNGSISSNNPASHWLGGPGFASAAASAVSSSSATVSSFTSIQAEQLHYQQARHKMLKKPLSRIQAEERAVKDLIEFYAMTKGVGSGEWVVVTRGEKS